jgi:hypothetical protein
MASTNAIPTLSATMALQCSLSQVVGTAGITGAPTASGIATPGISQTFQNLSNAVGNVQIANQINYNTLTLAASGTSTLDLSATFTNILNQSGSTFGSGISGVIWFLPTVAQAANYNVTITAQASSVTIGNAASNQFKAFLGSGTSTTTLNQGDIVSALKTNGGTYVISSTSKNLLFTNNDATNAATIIYFFIGS